MIKQFCDYLKELNVTQIISIDDEWGKIDTKSENTEHIMDMNITDFCKFYDINVLEDEEIDMDNKGILKIKDLKESKELEMQRLRGLCTSLIDQIHHLSLRNLKQILELISQESGITVNISDTLDLMSLPSTGRILFIIDKNMESSGGLKDSIVDTLLQINLIRRGKFDLVLVFSSDPLIEFETHGSKLLYVAQNIEQESSDNPEKYNLIKDLETEKYLLPYQLWNIRKNSYDYQILNSLINKLEEAVFGHSLYDYITSKLNINKKAIMNFVKIPPEYYDFVYKDIFIEGELFSDCIDRAFLSAIKMAEYEMFEKAEYKDALAQVHSVASNKDSVIKNEINSIIIAGNDKIGEFRRRTFQQKIQQETYKGIPEFGIADYSVNYVYKDIQTGDIFKITPFDNPTKPLYGILITPNCDLIVRFQNKNTKKVNRKLTTATLLTMSQSPLNNSPGTIKNLIDWESNGSCIWPIKDNDEYHILNLFAKNNLFSIDSEILDLCTVNKEGWANISHFNPAFIEHKSYHFKEYCENHLDAWLENFNDTNTYFPENRINWLQTNAAATTDICDYFENSALPLLVGLKHGIKLNINKHRLEVCRLARLDENRTMRIIQEYYNRMSRHGQSKQPFQ
jgi:hypothetical protein